jgi:hypothetical protein
MLTTTLGLTSTWDSDFHVCIRPILIYPFILLTSTLIIRYFLIRYLTLYFYSRSFDLQTGFVTKEVLAVPVLAGEEVVAVLQLLNKTSSAEEVDTSALDDSDDEIDREDGFSKAEEIIIEKICDELALVFAKIRDTTGEKDISTPNYSIKKNFCLKIQSISQLCCKADHDLNLQISCALFHGGIKLRESVSTTTRRPIINDGKVNSRFQELLEFDIQVANLPRATRIIFTVGVVGSNKKVEIIGWTACYLYDYQGNLVSNSKTLKLWKGECPNAMTITTLENSSANYGTLVVDFEKYVDSKIPVRFMDTDPKIKGKKEADPDSVKAGNKFAKLLGTSNEADYLKLIGEDQLYELSEKDKNYFYSHRVGLLDKSKALPKVLLSVDWTDRRAVIEMYSLLHRWELPTPVEALQLLDAKFPDPKVRAYAVECLEKMVDADLKRFMLQLTQVLKFEPFDDSALARFLLRRSLMNTQEIGQLFFWHLKAEMHVADVHNRFGILLEQYLRNCGEHRTALGHQVFVLQKLEEVANRLVKSDDNKAERLKLVKDGLSDIVFPTKFRLPLLPEFEFNGLNVEKCRYMNSKKLPLWLDFKIAEGTHPTKKNLMLMFKAGDDLRQDQLTLQVSILSALLFLLQLFTFMLCLDNKNHG